MENCIFLEIEARKEIAWDDDKWHCFDLLQSSLSSFIGTHRQGNDTCNTINMGVVA